MKLWRKVEELQAIKNMDQILCGEELDNSINNLMFRDHNSDLYYPIGTLVKTLERHCIDSNVSVLKFLENFDGDIIDITIEDLLDLRLDLLERGTCYDLMSPAMMIGKYLQWHNEKSNE